LMNTRIGEALAALSVGRGIRSLGKFLAEAPRQRRTGRWMRKIRGVAGGEREGMEIQSGLFF